MNLAVNVNLNQIKNFSKPVCIGSSILFLCVWLIIKPAPLQLHPWSLAVLQQDMRRRDPATDRQVPGAAVVLPDCCWPARWRVRWGQTCYESALLPYSLLWCFGQRKGQRKGGGGSGGGKGDTWKRGTARLGVWGVHGVLRELWGRYGSLSASLIRKEIVLLTFQLRIPILSSSKSLQPR